MFKKFADKYTYINFAFVLVGMSVSLLLFLSGREAQSQYVLLVISIVAIIPSIKDMILTLIKGQVGIDVIALVAIISSLFLGQHLAAGVILIMLTGGEALEEFAKNRAKRELNSLLKHKPTIAHLIHNGSTEEIPVSRIKVGDSILIKPGESIPVDGKLYKGGSSLDESAITGESIPINVGLGDAVLSGAINLDGVIEIHATKVSEDSQYEQIIKLVSEASTKKSPLIRLADAYSLPFTIITFVLAGIAWYISKDPVRALSVLVVATPCPLLIATPVAIVSGMSRAASRGVIIKSGGVLEQLSRLKAAAFDKTGTLTQGKPKVEDIEPCGISRNELLRIVASVEQNSTHTLAQIVVDAAKDHKIKLYRLKDNHEYPGKGILAKLDKDTIVVGSLQFLKEKGVNLNKPVCIEHGTKDKTALFVAKNKDYLGTITFVDPLRKESKSTINALKRLGVKKFVMLTGDRKEVGEKIASELGITDLHSEILPAQKVQILLEEKKKTSPIAMVGDGINDAPVLAASDVGIALGAKGSTAASEAADAVIMQDDFGRVSELVAISKRSVKIAKQSIFTGIGLSSVLMVFAVFGFIVPVIGALLQEVIDVVVILNALRARFKPKI